MTLATRTYDGDLMSDDKVTVVIYKLQKEEKEMTKEEAIELFNQLSQKENVQMIIKNGEPNKIYIAPELIVPSNCSSLQDVLLFLSDVKEIKKYARILLGLLTALAETSKQLQAELNYFIDIGGIEELDDDWGDDDDY